MRNAKKFLDLCTKKFPSPRLDQRHSLAVIDGVLILTLMQGDTYKQFDLDDADLDKEPEMLSAELESLVSAESAECMPGCIVLGKILVSPPLLSGEVPDDTA